MLLVIMAVRAMMLAIKERRLSAGFILAAIITLGIWR